MKSTRLHISLLLISLLLLLSQVFVLDAFAALNARTVRVLKNHEVCTKDSSGTTSSIDLSTLITNSDSVDSKASSSGSFCPVPPLFTGGAKLTTVGGITTQAQPVVQGLGRGILISEQSGDLGGVSSSGNPTDFNDLIVSFGGLTNLFFEVSLPSECDVIDDDNDIIGSEADLSLINDFSFPTCAATDGVTVACNTTTTELLADNGLVSGTPAKIRFVLSSVGSISDVNMIDSILLRLDSQDLFCPQSAMGHLTATVTVNQGMTFTSPTSTQTIGTVDLGTPTSAFSIGYAPEIVQSNQGEVSTNNIDTTGVLAPGSAVTVNPIEIKELDNESIPIGINSASISDSQISSAIMIEEVHLFLIPTKVDLFDSVNIMASDISFSDNSLVVDGNPVVVRTTADHAAAPFGSVVIKLKQSASSTTDPADVKTTITINNLKLSSISGSTASVSDSTVSFSLFEPASGAIINTPGVLSLFDSKDAINPFNYSAFSPGSTRAIKQNAVIGGAVNELVGADRIQNNTDLSNLTTRNTKLGAPQIIGFTKVSASVTDVNLDQVSTSESNLVITVTGKAGSVNGGATVTVSSNIDSVTVTSLSNGSFSAKLRGDFSAGDVALTLKQAVAGTQSNEISKSVSKTPSEALSCEQTVCGCESPDCTPLIPDVLTFISNNGELSSIVSSGGALLDELISAVKKALGLS